MRGEESAVTPSASILTAQSTVASTLSETCFLLVPEPASTLAVSGLGAKAPVAHAPPRPSPATTSAIAAPMATFRFNGALPASLPSVTRSSP